MLFSHPSDFTPVCTTELGVTAHLKDEFVRRGVKVIGLSGDSVSDRHRWAVDIEQTQGLAPNFPMFGDPRGEVAPLYDMLDPHAATTATVRSVFAIGPDNTVKLTLTYPASTGWNFEEILRAIDSLQLTPHHKVAIPLNWRAGEDCIIVPTVSDHEAATMFPDGWVTVLPYLRLVKQPTG